MSSPVTIDSNQIHELESDPWARIRPMSSNQNRGDYKKGTGGAGRAARGPGHELDDDHSLEPDPELESDP